MPDLRSAYLTNRSTEMALLSVLADNLRAVDSGDLAVLVLLDLSAASYTVDNERLRHRLKKSHGLGDWFQSDLSGCFQSVRCGGSPSSMIKLHGICGVPRGSVLRPITVLLQTCFDWFVHASRHELPLIYADDTHIDYTAFVPVPNSCF